MTDRAASRWRVNRSTSKTGETATTVVLRGLLLLLFAVGVAGAFSDLLLIGHVDGRAQQIPVVLLGAGLGVCAWLVISAWPAVLRVFQGLMLTFIVVGLLGLWLHYRGNIEFERELAPDLAGLELFWAAVRGAAPPSLAPASLIHLGLLGLAYTYRHPALTSCPSELPSSGDESCR